MYTSFGITEALNPRVPVRLTGFLFHRAHYQADSAVRNTARAFSIPTTGYKESLDQRQTPTKCFGNRWAGFPADSA